MTLTFAIFSKLKACHHSAQRWSAATTLGQSRAIFSTLKGLDQDTTLSGLLRDGDVTQGSASRNPGLKDGHPFRMARWPLKAPFSKKVLTEHAEHRTLKTFTRKSIRRSVFDVSNHGLSQNAIVL